MRTRDFRTIIQFTVANVDKSGRHIGRNEYWKLYAVENYYRVIIHSILSVQIQSSWWMIATNPSIQKKAAGYKQRYLNRPWYTSQGNHDIYYIDLFDLNEIVRVHANLFSPIIPDIDSWIAKVEDVRLPRNVVAHMNFPLLQDRKRIDLLYRDLNNLIKHLITTSQIEIKIP